jgi:predicted DNA-binding protein
MTMPLRKITIRLPPELWEKIRQRASSKGVTQSDFIRGAIDFYFKFCDDSGVNLQRIAELAEYNQLALYLVARRDFPELIDPILNVVNKRMREFHDG